LEQRLRGPVPTPVPPATSSVPARSAPTQPTPISSSIDPKTPSRPVPSVCPSAPYSSRFSHPAGESYRSPEADPILSSPILSSPSESDHEPDHDSDPTVEDDLVSFLHDLDTSHLIDQPLGSSTPPRPDIPDVLSLFSRPSPLPTTAPPHSIRYGFDYVAAAEAERVKKLLTNALNEDYSTFAESSPTTIAEELPEPHIEEPQDSTARHEVEQSSLTYPLPGSFFPPPSPLSSTNVVSGQPFSWRTDKSAPLSQAPSDKSAASLPTDQDPTRSQSLTDKSVSSPPLHSDKSVPSSPTMVGFTPEQMEQFKTIAELFTKAQAAAPATTASTSSTTSSDYFKQQALRPEVAGLFWPDYDPRSQGHGNYNNLGMGLDSLITNKDGTFYRDCQAWFDIWPRLSEAAGGDNKLAALLEVYLRGTAKFWWSFSLTDEERTAMRKDLKLFAEKVSSRFAPKASTALAQLNTLVFSMRDVMAGKSVSVWFHQRYRCVQQAGVSKVSDILQDCWAGLDAQLRCNVVAPSPDETTESFVNRLEQMEVTWREAVRNNTQVRSNPYPYYPQSRGLMSYAPASNNPFRGPPHMGPGRPPFVPNTRLPFAPYMGRGGRGYGYGPYRPSPYGPMGRFQQPQGRGFSTNPRGYGSYGQSDARGYGGSSSQSRTLTNPNSQAGSSNPTSSSTEMVVRNQTTPSNTNIPNTAGNTAFNNAYRAAQR
ncbi:hypothetical protein BJ508DRAFT_316338, partial [Ascobolus immersus RN42]